MKTTDATPLFVLGARGDTATARRLESGEIVLEIRDAGAAPGAPPRTWPTGTDDAFEAAALAARALPGIRRRPDSGPRSGRSRQEPRTPVAGSGA